MVHRAVSALLIFAACSLSACKDKAQPDYARCVQLDTAGDTEDAWAACNAAVAADPNSTSGKAATTKLTEMKPKYDAWEKDRVAKAAAAADAQRKADAERAKAELQALSATVSCGRTDEDDHCVSGGKPPKGRECKGGTYDDNEKFALLKGCEHSHVVPSMASLRDLTFNLYCCPN